jgi:DNA-binding GntR family transcriptional regulator
MPLGLDDAPPSRLIAYRAYAELRDRIVTLRLPPRSVLREEGLMRDLAIGRTPLRDAIKRLSMEGLVAIQPRRGTTVTDVDASDIVDITDVRAELEGHAAERAAVRMDDEMRATCAELRDELEALERGADNDALMRLDERIHRFTWRAARNPYLLETLGRYFTLSLRVWYLVLDRVPALDVSVHDQAELLQALQDGDPARARTVMREHVLDFQSEVLAAFDGARPA